MSSVVHFKFRSSLKFDSIRFNGHEISIQDLKDEIVKTKKLDKFMEDYDLMITNDQTKNEYKGDDFVPKNSSVIVARFPITKPKRDLQKKAVSSPIQTAENESTLECISKMADVASMNLSEEDKLITVMDQGNREFDNVNYSKLRKIPRGPVPKNYVCHRCGMPGHFIQKCPRTRDINAVEPFPKLKRSTGIPISFMTTVDDINTPGVLLTSCGRLAVPIIDAEAYRIGKKEKPPFVKSEVPETDERANIPKELTCPVCDELLTDAVVLPCCGDSACDSCVMTELLQSTSPKCPVCKKSGVSPLDVIPNKSMRAAVFNYKNETGYTAMSKREASASHPSNQIKSEPEMEEKPLMNVGLKFEMPMKAESIVEDRPHESLRSVSPLNLYNPQSFEVPQLEDKPQHEIMSTGAHLPMAEHIPISGMKGAKMVRVLVARPGAPLPTDQTASGTPYTQMSAMNIYSLPPPPLPHNYHTIISQPRMIQHGTNAMPLNQARNSHVLIYPGPLSQARVMGPPPSLVSISTGGPMPMNFPQRIPGAMQIAMPIPTGTRMPMTEEEFYREKDRLRELERNRRHHTGASISPYSPRRDSRPARKKDVFEFAEDIMYKKGPRIRRRSRSRSYVRSRSRSRSRRSSSSSNTTTSSQSLRGRNRRSSSRTRKYRHSRSPGRKSHSSNRSPSPRKDMSEKMYKDVSRRSVSPRRPRGRRSRTPPRKEMEHSRSPNKFVQSSRSNSSRRSFGRPHSRSRSPKNKKYLREEEPPLGYRSNKMASKRMPSSRSPPTKRQRDSIEFRPQGYSPYDQSRRSQSPSKNSYKPVSISRYSERFMEKDNPEFEDYYKQYKDWHAKYNRDTQVQRLQHREHDLSRSPHKRRPNSRDSRSRSRESPYARSGRREERKEDLRGSERIYNKDRYVKSDAKVYKRDEKMIRQDKKEYNYRDRESERPMETELCRRPEIRKEQAKEQNASDDRKTRKEEERKNMKTYSAKEMHKIEVSANTMDARLIKSSEIRSPPPKSKVQIINPKETRIKEVHGSLSSEPVQASKETSVRIVTKDTCKSMKITVSSKWDSDVEHEKRFDREKPHKIETILENASIEGKSVKHKKKHKKDKKKLSKKHKSKGPE